MPSNRHPSRSPFWERALQRFMKGVFRLWSRLGGRRSAQVGFVFPTTLLLVLMVLLTVTALTYRSFTRSQSAIVEREQQVIYNSATPAIDRAKAKLEFLFNRDDRLPNGLPNSDLLAQLMLPYDATKTPLVSGSLATTSGDPYTLQGETRIDINNDGNLDNAWYFLTDLNGDGTTANNEIVAYSILMDDESGTGSNRIRLGSPVNDAKAQALVTRTGPLATTETAPNCESASPEGGWQVVNSSLQKNFQVDVFVANTNAANPTYETLEFQQSRIANRANKWGAWFRYDLEFYPGRDFNWNGAMHTDGNFGIADRLEVFMISSHNSCLYSKESSEITLGKTDTFEGQAYSGSHRKNEIFTGNINVHLWKDNDNTVPEDSSFNDKTDSITGPQAIPSAVSMDPLKLFTEDVAAHIVDPGPSTWERDGAWESRKFFERGRIYNDVTTKPFVDDFFRADNRWGPKPKYDDNTPTFDVTKRSEKAGDPITGVEALTKNTPGDEGLDGYWERRAMNTGMRVIVGERLELGNRNGWGFDPTFDPTKPTIQSAAAQESYGTGTGAPLKATDPLYPPDRVKTSLAVGNNKNVGDNHEYMQRRTLRDNLSAVQGMVVYHYQIQDGKFPAACMAMTAHPGTNQTIFNSRDFSKTFANGSMKADFFNGIGTNGWEFKFPDTFDTASEFATEVESQTRPLGVALRNLATFAGDPLGGAPSFPAVQDGNVHPAPYLSMWGDFSVLRRVLALMDTGGKTYANLSPADQATLHSAACTLSLLAYNVSKEYNPLTEADFNVAGFTGNRLQNVTENTAKAMDAIIKYMAIGTDGNIRAGKKVSQLFNDFSPPKTRTPWTDPDPSSPCTSGTDSTGFQEACDAGDYFSQYTWSDWEVLLREAGNATPAEITAIKNYGVQLGDRLYGGTGAGLLRDRELGFRRGQATELPALPASLNKGSNSVVWDLTNGYTEPVIFTGSSKYQVKLQCNPNYYGAPVAQGSGGKGNVVALAATACAAYFKDGPTPPPIDEVKYPSLYYLFPMTPHDHDGTGLHAQPDGVAVPPATQAPEEYITNAYVKSVNLTATPKPTYSVVGSNKWDGMSAIAAIPKAPGASNWVTPYATVTSADMTKDNIQDRDRAFRIKVPGGGEANVAFLDKVIGNGREQFPVRVLDMDLDALTTKAPTGATDLWLTRDLAHNPPARGIVYAAREDAVREDEIVRPKASGATFSACLAKDPTNANNQIFALERVGSCLMRATPGSEQDPPLSDEGISLKPVDFAPDPMRRPYGFRLRTLSGNPADFSGGISSGTAAREVGMTFVTDNALYIQGDFNLHSTNNTVASLVEEFRQTILDKGNYSKAQFYNNRTTLNTDTFAKFNKDHWRPVELLSDSLNILSQQFIDGSLRDYFVKATPGTAGGADSSMMNLNRPDTTTPKRYMADVKQPNVGQQNTTDSADAPVYVDRNGTFYSPDGTGGAIRPFSSDQIINKSWMDFRDNGKRHNNLIDVTQDMYVNAVFVSNIVPKRPGQGYGGIHNYPRFLEYWRDQNLYIQGSFIQLNFSTAATAPFDQDSWEPGQSPSTSDERYHSYEPPNRRWGYDVGLLYVPPGAATERFVTIGFPRSEYYRELPADDPYIKNLKCAKSGGQRIFGAAITAGCPS